MRRSHDMRGYYEPHDPYGYAGPYEHEPLLYDVDYEPDAEYYFPSRRRRYLPNGCATVLLVAVVLLAFVVLMVLTFHPQGFQLFHF